MVDFVEICNVYARKVITEAAKRINNSDKVCRSYSDLNFGVTFLEHSAHSVYTTYFFAVKYLFCMSCVVLTLTVLGVSAVCINLEHLRYFQGNVI